MTTYTYVAFLRGINVGGANKLPMQQLRDLCEAVGLSNVRTYIQSGNVIFGSDLSEAKLITLLEAALAKMMGRRIPVVVRTAKQLEQIVSGNPFPKAAPARVGVMLFVKPVAKGFAAGVSTPGREEVTIARREVYIHYLDGMGRSKLKLPKQADEGTVRNLNTLTKLVQLCQAT
jgi:uncharacterized protein (DUF1697 family)